MKIAHQIGALATALATLTSPAFAQSASDDWQGAYIGGSIGVSLQPNDNTEIVEFDTNLDGTFGDTVRTTTGANAFSPGFCGGASFGRTPAEGCRKDKDATEAYIRAGYDIRNGNLVYGVVVDAGTSNARDSVTAFSSTPALYIFSRELEYSIGARARVGMAADRALFYVTGGVAYGKIDNNFVTSNMANSFTGNGSANSFGYSAGLGADMKIVRNFSVGIEYLYSNFGEDDYVISVGPGTAPVTNPFRIVNTNGTNMRRGDADFETHNLRLTTSYRF
jgi:outer membrane immunogenic protein